MKRENSWLDTAAPSMVLVLALGNVRRYPRMPRRVAVWIAATWCIDRYKNFKRTSSKF